MIYNITILKDKYSIGDLIDTLESLGDFYICDKSYYIHTDLSISDLNEKVPYINEIREITYDNYSSIDNNMIKKFCIERLSKDALSKFEETEEGQKQILEVVNFLDKMENIQKGAMKVAENKEKDECGTTVADETHDIGDREQME